MIGFLKGSALDAWTFKAARNSMLTGNNMPRPGTLAVKVCTESDRSAVGSPTRQLAAASVMLLTPHYQIVSTLENAHPKALKSLTNCLAI